MIDSDGKEHAKYLCMLEHNVKILLRKDILPYQKYFKNHHNESDIVETKKKRNYKVAEYFKFKCLETNKIYDSVNTILEVMKFCCPKDKNLVTLRLYIKECCEGKKEHYKHYHFEYI